MKFKFFSIVVGTTACIANCPFCVSGEPLDKNNKIPNNVNWRNFKIAKKLATNSNIDTVMLTSRGEPSLFPAEITEYLKQINYDIPLIELQTNGLLFSKKRVEYDKYLKLWYSLGLTTINISIVSYNPDINKIIYTNNSDYIDLPELIDYLHEIGFSIRLTCICCKEWMSTNEQVLNLINFAKINKVEQLSFRPLNDEFRRKSAQDWIDKNKLTEIDKETIIKFLDKNGTRLLELDRLGIIYDYEGQNVFFSYPLNMNIRDTNPENMRQLIFFPDGHIRYEWEKTGSIIL